MKNKLDIEQFNLSRFRDIRYLKFLYFSRYGRISREYFFIAQMLIVVPGVYVLKMAPESANLAIVLLFYPLILYIEAALCIKRAHDLDRSGHFCWLLLIPLVFFWPLFELYIREGKAYDNRFGPKITT